MPSRERPKLKPTQVKFNPSGPPPTGPRYAPKGPRSSEAPRFTSNSKPFVRPSRAAARGDTRLPPSVRTIHEDDDLILVDKPADLLTAGMPGEDLPSLFEMLKRQIRSRGPRRRPTPGESRRAGQGVYIIHRLDREASGILVFAKNEHAFVALKDAFKERKPHRLYLAVVEGNFGQVGSQTTIQSNLIERHDGTVESLPPEAFRGAHGAKPRQRPGPDNVDEQPAKLAVTHVRVVAVGNGLSLLQVRLETGRKHQIRVHLSERGHPIVGDRRYRATVNPLSRLGLHALELGFVHPTTNQTVRYRTQAPAPFYRAVGATPPPLSEEPESDTPPPASPSAHSTHTPHLAAAPLAAANAPRAPRPPDSTPPGSTQPGEIPPDDTSWDHVANWYDQLLTERRSDHYDQVIIPGTVRLIAPTPHDRILDLACGQGVVTRALAAAAKGAELLGLDSAEALIDAARAHAAADPNSAGADFRVADVRALRTYPLQPASFDGVSCVMSLSNFDPLEPVLADVAHLLKPGGRFVAVISHPGFRIPGQTAWGWDAQARRQYRRIDSYLSPTKHAIEMNPGQAASGAPSVKTWTFHRPLSAYINALAAAGLRVDRLEEWSGQRVSQPGPRADEENRARREIPLFVAIRAVK